MALPIRFAYANLVAHTIDGNDSYDYIPLEDRIDDVVSIMLSMGDIILAVECEDAPADYIVSHMKATGDTDWAVRKSEHAKACFYRPSLYSYVSVNILDLAADTRMIDYYMVQDATQYKFHAMVCHLKVGADEQAARVSAAKEIAAYAKSMPNCILAGDFNDADNTSTAHAKGILNATAGLVSLQIRGAVNSDRDSWDGDYTGKWIDDLLTKTTQSVTDAAMVPTNGASDHWGWIKATVDMDGVPLADGDTAGTYTSRITYSGNNLHIFDAQGKVTICTPAGPETWIPKHREATYDPEAPGDPDDPDDTTTQAKLVAWHKARLGDFHYSQGTGRLDPVHSGVTDCSGLQYACYKAVMGINIGTNSRDQADNPHGGTVVTTTRSAILAGTGMQKGDLIFYAHPDQNWSHVEMYIGGSQVVGISNTREDGPRIQALSLQVNYFKGKLKVLRYV